MPEGFVHVVELLNVSTLNEQTSRQSLTVVVTDGAGMDVVAVAELANVGPTLIGVEA